MAENLKCLGDLPERWYRDADTLVHECNVHGSNRAVARAHGVSQYVIRKWRDRLGIPPSTAKHGPAASVGVPPSGAIGLVTEEDLLREEVKELRKRLREERTTELAEERMLRLIEANIPAIPPTSDPPERSTKSEFTEHEFVLQWSDLHAAEHVSAEQTNGLNEYGWESMVERHWRMRDAILSFKRNRPYPVNRITVVPLGDMVSGDIHDELRETNEKVLAECAVQIGYFGADFVASLAEEFPEVIVTGCVTGNHGRRSKKPQAKNVHDSFDWIAYEVMHARLSGLANVTMDVQKARHAFIEIAGKRILCWHGDGVRSTMVGVPWGGITRRCNELQKQYERTHGSINHFFIGHWHEPHVVANRRICVNGSTKGPDEYGISMGMAAPATQLLHTFHPTRGMTETCYLDLQSERS